ncbi:hypothetical protein [Aeoliella mucimassa]|nr:hypothetical protein [Aeoliella mucimassa]
MKWLTSGTLQVVMCALMLFVISGCSESGSEVQIPEKPTSLPDDSQLKSMQGGSGPAQPSNPKRQL